MGKFSLNNFSTSTVEYYAISKDGNHKSKLTSGEALSSMKSGKARFWLDKRECTSVELDCDVYKKETSRAVLWQKIN